MFGRQSSGTLCLSEDERGPSAEIDLPDTSDGRCRNADRRE
ncbi:MAG: HK97 family phage prohead protease [Xanthomonadales bacterium]|nr:HK97 family phage prohead protease [Xanthomonadales bacterium]